KQNLYVSLRVNRFRGTTITDGTEWGKDDGAEIRIQGQRPNGTKTMFTVRGFAGGALQCMEDSKPANALQKQARFAGKISKTRWGASTGWKGEWQIPLAALGITPKPGLTIPFNVRVYITETSTARGWEAKLGKLTFSEK
ncbi:MAG: hypothetical protein HN904_25225, partial [Victivallales bacterium]|nr:hypothetical protein [Victivallales bacterium]